MRQLAEFKGPIVDLPETAEAGLILAWKTGVAYSNQAGGYACLHPAIEGFYLPIEPSTLPQRLMDYFEGPPYDGSGALDGLTAADADVIDDALRATSETAGVAVDRGRLAESCEAWVHVTIDAARTSRACGLSGVLRGFAPFPARAVLVWPNSD